jgi:N-acetylglutamate synthase/N-acetylornithine aminotransferase
MGNFEVFDGDITSPKGYKASGLNIGLKKDKKDMALIVSDGGWNRPYSLLGECAGSPELPRLHNM